MGSRAQQRMMWVLICFGLAVSNILVGQEPKLDGNSERLEKRYTLFIERAKKIELATTSGDSLLLNDTPLMKYSRDGGKRLGSVFLWTNKQRRRQPSVQSVRFPPMASICLPNCIGCSINHCSP